jgi:Mor family transcriptional regulator
VTNNIKRVHDIAKGLSPGSLAAVSDVVGHALEQAPLQQKNQKLYLHITGSIMDGLDKRRPIDYCTL